MLCEKMVLMFQKVTMSVLKVANTLYNLHIYVNEIAVLHVTTYELKKNNMVISSYFFFSAFEEMKICINHVENANPGIGL